MGKRQRNVYESISLWVWNNCTDRLVTLNWIDNVLMVLLIVPNGLCKRSNLKFKQ